MTRPALLTLALACLVLLAGCARGPKPVPVTGSVLYHDKALCPANVHFQPVGGEGKQAYSPLQTDGSFSMKTANVGDGVIPGKYKVTISTGLGNPPDLAGYDEKEATPIEVEVPSAGLKDFVIAVPIKGKKP